jgi:hypothetical protein
MSYKDIKDQKIALVHQCNWGMATEVMSRKGYWFRVYDDNISAGDFVVTENFLPMSTKRVLTIGYVSKITTNGIEGLEESKYPIMNVITRVVASGQVFKKPIFEDEYGVKND